MTRFFDSDGREVDPPKPVGELEHVCTLGGDFEKTSVSLCIRSEQLDREEVSRLLGTSPTRAWNPGEPHHLGEGKTGLLRSVDWGLWDLRTLLNATPVETKIRELLASCTEDLQAWRHLGAKYNMKLTVVGYLSNWNGELHLDTKILNLLVERGVQLVIDVYFTGDDDE